MASMVSFVMLPEGEQIDTRVLQEKMKAIQKEREEKFAHILKDRLNWYIKGDKGLYNKLNLRFNSSIVQLMESICFRQVATYMQDKQQRKLFSLLERVCNGRQTYPAAQ